MFQNIPKEKILEVVKQGPTIPVKIAKAVKGDTMIVGAILSTLISTGDVRVSTLKIGGTPVYYVPDQESRLEEFTSYLNEKDQKTFKVLKDSGVLRDTDQDPLIRVSLRAIKDFAKSFEVESGGQKIIFWRFYSIPKEDAIVIAKDMLKKEQEEKVRAEVVEQPDVKAREIKAPEMKTQEMKPAIIEERHAEKQMEERTEEEKHETPKKSESSAKADFFEIVKKHILSKNLDIISKEKIKKSEYDFVLKNHDTNEYIYCKSKDKKSINEGDLASAFVFAQSKKMPCLFLTTGNLTKKAESMRHKEFNGLAIEKVTL
jgi:hypothetical protein